MDVGKRTWIFGERGKNVLIFSRSLRAGLRYTPVKGYNSPYDANLHNYWKKRYGKSWRNTTPRCYRISYINIFIEETLNHSSLV